MDFRISFAFVLISFRISLGFMDFVWPVVISRGAVATRKVAPADFRVAPVLRRTQSCGHRIETYLVCTGGRRHSFGQPRGLSTCCVTRSLRWDDTRAKRMVRRVCSHETLVNRRVCDSWSTTRLHRSCDLLCVPNGVLRLRGLAGPQQELRNTWGAMACDTLRAATAPREMTTSQTKSMKSNEILPETHTETDEIVKPPAFLKE